MAQQKHTKKSLLASGLSLLTCIALLLGTTFAWFTDSSTSGRNTITAGNLDVELYHTNATVADEKVSANTPLFTDENGETIRWEPGVMTYENFKVVNEGTLALTYKLVMDVLDNNTVAGTNKSLADVIKVGIMDGAFNGDRNAALSLDFSATLTDFVKTGTLLETDASDSYAVVLYWEPSSIDNDYNLSNENLSSDGQPLFIELGISLNATQTPHESDSFDEQYDKNADESVAITSGTGHVLNQDITVIKPGGVGVSVAGQGTEVTIEGGTINGGSGGNNVGVWAQPGTTVNITGGTFTVGADASGSGNSVVYSTGGVINISGGFFYTNTAYNGKYYVLNLQNGSGGQIHVTGGTFVNFDPSNGDDVNPGSFVEEGYTVVAEQQPNGDTWYTVVKGDIAASDETSFKDALGSVKEGETIVLANNIEIARTGSRPDGTYDTYVTTPNCTIDLNGKKLTVRHTGYVFSLAADGITLKNGTIEIADKENTGYPVYVTNYSENIVIEDVTVIGGIQVIGGSSATLRNVNITATTWYDVYLEYNSTVTIESGTFTSNGASPHIYTATNSDQVIVKGGTFDGDDTPKYSGNGAVTIE